MLPLLSTKNNNKKEEENITKESAFDSCIHCQKNETKFLCTKNIHFLKSIAQHIIALIFRTMIQKSKIQCVKI